MLDLEAEAEAVHDMLPQFSRRRFIIELRCILVNRESSAQVRVGKRDRGMQGWRAALPFPESPRGDQRPSSSTHLHQLQLLVCKGTIQQRH
jgi:hypothetical protein